MAIYTSNGGEINATEASDIILVDILDRIGKSKINAGGGNNRITVKYGSETAIKSGSGQDVITIQDVSSVFLDAGEGSNSIQVTGFSNAEINSGSGNDTIFADAGRSPVTVLNINAGEGQNWIKGSATFTVVRSGSGNDVIQASGFTASVSAGEGNNVVQAEGFSAGVSSGAGNDRVLVRGTRSGGANVGEGNNRVLMSLAGGSGRVSAGAGDDIIAIGGGSLEVDAGEGNNQVSLSGGTATLRVGAGNDFVVSNCGGTFSLGEGNNFFQFTNNQFDISSTLTISAGFGRDVFSLNTFKGSVTLEGYGSNDKISLANLAGVRTQQNGADVTISNADRSLTVTVKNTNRRDINLVAGLTRAISADLQDPFNSGMPLAISQKLATPFP
jgi:Ca2+-binding RTX toxin-like protein